MGAMKSWAMVCEELHAAREHWEQCNHARGMACRAELEAHIRLERAKADHMAEVNSWIASHSAPEASTAAPVASDGAGSSQDATGTPPACDCEETCAECGKAVPEDECADTPWGEPVLHDDCRAEWEAGRSEYEAECRAEASLMFGEGRGTL